MLLVTIKQLPYGNEPYSREVARAYIEESGDEGGGEGNYYRIVLETEGREAGKANLTTRAPITNLWALLAALLTAARLPPVAARPAPTIAPGLHFCPNGHRIEKLPRKGQHLRCPQCAREARAQAAVEPIIQVEVPDAAAD